MSEDLEKIKKFAKNMRKDILDMSLAAGAKSSHFGGALSIVEIVATIFSNIIRLDPTDPLWEDRDRFILSKGHACLAYYSALSEIGYIKKEELQSFEKDESNLLGHPIINKNLGIEFSNGSLGMGLSLGIGLSLSSKKKKKDFKVYVILGDGECNEGSVWEAAMSAAHLKLDNLHVVLDRNNFQQTGSNADIMDLKNLVEKWKSFGWHTEEIDGHNINEILNFFKKSNKIKLPKIAIANTIKGKGFSFSENNNDWHHSILTKKNYDSAVKELDLE